MRSDLSHAVTVRVGAGGRHIEVVLASGFAPSDLDAVRSLPGRRWDPAAIVPGAVEPIRMLVEWFGEDRVRVDDSGQERTGPPPPGELAAEDPLVPVREALLLRGYSPSTRKVYLGHLRRFFAWCGAGPATLPSIPSCCAEAMSFISSRTAASPGAAKTRS